MSRIDVRKLANSPAGQKLRTRARIVQLKLEKKYYRRPISIDEIKSELLKLGSWDGRVVWVQSAWNQFYNVQIPPTDFIDLLLEMVGPAGTLAMPAFPLQADPTSILDIDRAPTSTGLLTELFRRYPGACRSIHIRSSVAAVGPQAEYLTRDHHLTKYPWGPGSPYDRIRELKGLMVSLGFMSMGLTPLHYVECVLHHDVPAFRQLFSTTTTYSWKRRDGTSGTHTFLNRTGWIRPQRIKRYFVPDLYRETKLSNLRICGMPAFEGIERAMELARLGKTIYPNFGL